MRHSALGIIFVCRTSQVSLAHKHLAEKKPKYGPTMHPGCFQEVILLEDCIGNDELYSVQNSGKRRPLSLQLPTPSLSLSPSNHRVDVANDLGRCHS